MREPVCVVWHDAHSGHDTWQYIEDMTDKEPYVVWSVGWVLDEAHGGKPGHMSIVQSWSDDDAVDSVLHIPTAMVVRTVNLRGLGGDQQEGPAEDRGILGARRPKGKRRTD